MEKAAEDDDSDSSGSASQAILPVLVAVRQSLRELESSLMMMNVRKTTDSQPTESFGLGWLAACFFFFHT